MVAQAEDLINNSMYDDAAALLKKAIASNPARWQAYNSLAKVQLYFTHDPTSAFQNYQAALAHGGTAASTFITTMAQASSPRRAPDGCRWGAEKRRSKPTTASIRSQ